MDFKIITAVLALTLMASGKPVKVRVSVGAPQVKLQTSSTVASSESSKFSKSYQSSSNTSGVSQAHHSLITISLNNPPITGPITQLSTSGQQVSVFPSSSPNEGHKPHKVVILENPVTGELPNMGCNLSSKLLVKVQNDPVESDFSASQLTDTLQLEDITSGMEDDQFHFDSGTNFPYANEASTRIIPSSLESKQTFDRENVTNNTVTEEFDESANNDFSRIDEELNDPVLSDFSANRISSTPYPASTVASATSVDVTSDAEPPTSNTTIDAEDKAVTTIIPVATVISSEGINISNNSGNDQAGIDSTIDSSVSAFGSNTVDLEVNNFAKDEVSVAASNNTEKTTSEGITISDGLTEEQAFEMGATSNNTSAQGCSSCNQMSSEATTINSPGQTQDIGRLNELNSEQATSTEVSLPANEQKPVAPADCNSCVLDEEEHISSGEMSASAGSVTKNSIQEVLSEIQKETINKESQSVKNQTFSEFSDSSTSVDGQQPVSIVTAVSANKHSSNQVDSQLNNTSNKPFESKVASGISVSATPVTGEEPITIVTAIPYNSKSSLVQSQLSNKFSKPSGSQISLGMLVSSSSVNEQEPITVVWASNPTDSHLQNQQFETANSPLDNKTSSKVIYTSNGHKLTTVDKNLQTPKGQVSFSGISVSSSSINGQKPVTIVSAANPLVLNHAMGGQVSSGNFISSNRQKPVTTFTPFNPISGLISEMQNQLINKPFGNQMMSESSASSNVMSEQRPVITNNPAPGGQIPNNVLNIANTPIRESVSGTGMTFSSNSEKGQQSVSVMTATNHPETTINTVKNRFNNIDNKPVSSSFVTEKKPTMMPTGGNIPMGNFFPMQDQFFNRPIGSQMFPFFFGGLGNQQHQTTDIFNNIKDQLNFNIPLKQQISKPMGSQGAGASSVSNSSINEPNPITVVSNTHSENGLSSFSGMSVSSSSVNGQKPETVFTIFKPSSEIMSETQNQQANKPIGSQVSVGSSVFSSSINGQEPVAVVSNTHSENGQSSFSGMSVSSSSVNGQKPETVFTIFKPSSEIMSETQNQQANKPIGSQISVGSSVFSSSINGQEPVAVVSNTHSENGQPLFSGMSVSSSSVNRQKPETVFTIFKPSSEILSETENQQANKPIGSQISVGSSIFSSSINGQEPVAVVSNTHSENGQSSFSGMSVSSSSVNGQKPETVFTIFKPSSEIMSETQNKQANKPIGSQISVGSSLFSSSINGQEPVAVVSNTHAKNGQSSFSEMSVSSSSVNGQNPETVFTISKPSLEILSETQNQQANKPIGSQISVGSSVFSSSINGQEPVAVVSNTHSENGQSLFSGMSVSSSSVNGQKPETVFTISKPSLEILSETQNQQANKPIASQISVGSSVFSSSINGQEPVAVVSNTHSENGQSSFSEMSVSSSFVNGQKPETGFTFFRPSSEIMSETQNQQANKPIGSQISVGSSVFSSSIKGQEPVAVVSNTHTENGQSSFSGMSVSSSSVNGQKPETVFTIFKPSSEILSETQNQQANKPIRSQISVGSSVFGSYINKQEPVAVVSNTHSENGQSSFSGMSVSSSSVNVQKPETVFTIFKPSSEILSETQNQQKIASQISVGSSVFSSPINGQEPVAVVSNTHLEDGQPSFSGASVSSSSVNSEKPETVVSVFKPAPGVFVETQNQQINKPEEKHLLEETSASSSSINKQNHLTTTINPHSPNGPSTGGNLHMGGFNQMQNQFFYRPMGSQMFPPFFGGFVDQQPTTGFFNQMVNQFPNNMANRPAGHQGFVGTSIQSSSSSVGGKTQTTVTSTDSLTGKVTETKYESSGGKPVAVFQSVLSSVDGEKSQTVITSKNSITGEGSQTTYESSSVKNLPRESDDLFGSSTIEDLHTSVTTEGTSQLKFSTSSPDVHNVEEEKTGEEVVTPPSHDSEPDNSKITPMVEEHKFESVGGASTKRDVSVENATATITATENSSLNAEVGFSTTKLTSTEIVGSNNAKTPVTILTTNNPSIGASTHVGYVAHPYYLVNNSLKLTSKRVIINPDAPAPCASSPMEEIAWTKRKYSIFDSAKPVQGGVDFSSLYSGQKSQPVVASRNSLPGKINQRLNQFSGMNAADLPINIRLFSKNWIYPAAEPVSQRVMFWTWP